MDGQNNFPEFNVIQAAVSGEKWAIDRIIAHYEDFLNEQSTVEVVQPDGSVKKSVDEDLKKRLIQKLIEEIPNFQAGNGQTGNE